MDRMVRIANQGQAIPNAHTASKRLTTLSLINVPLVIGKLKRAGPIEVCYIESPGTTFSSETIIGLLPSIRTTKFSSPSILNSRFDCSNV